MFKENLELRRSVFEKMGWELNSGKHFTFWKYPDMPELTFENVIYRNNLPKIETDWQVTAQYLVPFMREKGFVYAIEESHFIWIYVGCDNSDISPIEIKIIDNNLPLAACKAFMEVEL